MRLISGMAIVLILLALYGCLGGGGEPVQNETGNATNQTNQTQPPPVQIIIGQQKNQTQEQNVTPSAPQENATRQYDYTYDANQSFGIFFIYVGGTGLHGDAIFIKKGDLDVLVDAGPAEKAGKVVDFLRSRGVDDIDVLVSTTGDPRRYGGITAVADNFKIENFWWPGSTFGDQSYAALVERMKRESNATAVEEGFAMDLNGMNFTALNPPNTARFDDVNNDAIVLRVTDRNFSILLTSGIQTGGQGLLLNQKESEIKTAIMQAPYYGVGAGTSNIGIFLLKAEPDVVIITGSADESAANGGSREPFRRTMRQYGIKWYENYVNGTLRITSDGKAYVIQPVPG